MADILGRFAKMPFFGTSAKGQPSVSGKKQRNSSKAVTEFASKTVETASVSINRIAKQEIPVQAVQDTAVGFVTEKVAEKKEPENTPQNTAKGNPWGEIVSQIESRSGELEHSGERRSDRKKYPCRPSSVFADKPAESGESTALKKFINNTEVREEAAERLNSIFNESASGREEYSDERSYRKNSPPRQRQREQRGQRDDRQEPRRNELEERDEPQRGYPKHSGSGRGFKFKQREHIEEQENGNDFTSWEERQRFQDRQGFQEKKRERRVISGHFSRGADNFAAEEEDDFTSVDPVLVQAAKSAPGWDGVISVIIEGNIRRHQSNGNYSSSHNPNYNPNRQNRR
jgi:hypothetical protein